MSLILDALNRADRERNVEQAVPTLRSEHRPVASRRQWWRQWWRWELGGALVGLAALISYVLLDLNASSDQTTQRPVADTAAATALPGQRVADSNGPADAGLRQPVSDATPAPTGAAADADAIGSLAGGGSRGTSAANAPAADDAVGRLYRASLAPPPADQRRPSAEVDEPSSEELAASLVDQALMGDPAGVPYITDLPLQLRREIPSLNYSEHLPSVEPTDSRVRLNGKLLGQGQTVAPDLELLAIDGQGIILRFRGVEFRLPVLNRWVNF